MLMKNVNFYFQRNEKQKTGIEILRSQIFNNQVPEFRELLNEI